MEVGGWHRTEPNRYPKSLALTLTLALEHTLGSQANAGWQWARTNEPTKKPSNRTSEWLEGSFQRFQKVRREATQNTQVGKNAASRQLEPYFTAQMGRLAQMLTTRRCEDGQGDPTPKTQDTSAGRYWQLFVAFFTWRPLPIHHAGHLGVCVAKQSIDLYSIDPISTCTCTWGTAARRRTPLFARTGICCVAYFFPSYPLPGSLPFSAYRPHSSSSSSSSCSSSNLSIFSL